MIKVVWYLSLFLAFKAHGLVPVEGILMGRAPEEIQQDPLNFIFSDIYDRSVSGENKKIKLYYNTFKSGSHLAESCTLYSSPKYASAWQEKQARRSVASTLQYLGLDTTIKAIGAYARKLEMSEEDFNKLSSNLVRNYCSKNITIFSLKTIEKALSYYYSNPQSTVIPNVETSPFATELYKYRTESNEARENEFEYAVRGFRSFCSWGGAAEDYRMLAPYLSNRFIMAFVIKNMQGLQDQYDERGEKVTRVQEASTVQVVCEDLICRKVSLDDFKMKFPLTVGSTGIDTDLAKLYCGHFRFQDYTAQNTIPEVKSWIKATELEDPIFETNFFLSLMTGVPDPFMGITRYQELPFLAKSSIDERWNNWSRNVLNIFSRDLLFEESLKVITNTRRDPLALGTEGFMLNFHVTLGAMDQLMGPGDKVSSSVNIKLSKNYLRSMKTRWSILGNEVDTEGQRALKQEMTKFIGLQIKDKEKLFGQKVWNEDFPRLIAEELLGQIFAYQGPLFNSYQDQVLTIPVKFHYGLFALSYLRYRADVEANRMRLNL